MAAAYKTEHASAPSSAMAPWGVCSRNLKTSVHKTLDTSIHRNVTGVRLTREPSPTPQWVQGGTSCSSPVSGTGSHPREGADLAHAAPWVDLRERGCLKKSPSEGRKLSESLSVASGGDECIGERRSVIDRSGRRRRGRGCGHKGIPGGWPHESTLN